jgi:PST family polysaccharide transporter
VEFATYGHFFMVSSFLVTASSFGLANAFAVYIARSSTDTSHTRDNEGAVMTLGLVTGMVTAFLLLCLFFVDQNGVLLPKIRGWNLSWWVGFAVISAAATAVQSILLGKERNLEYQLVTGLNPAASCVALIAAMFLLHVNPMIAILTYMAGFLVPLVGYPAKFVYLRSIRFAALIPLLRFSLPYLIPSLLIPTVGTICALSVRHVIAVHVNTRDLGLWQALWRLSEGYMGALISVGTALFLPRFSRIATRQEALRSLAMASALLVGMYLPLAICFLTIPRIVLGLLLSSEFSAISVWLPIQIIGDILKTICFVVGIFFICMLSPRLALLGELLFSATFLGLSFVFVSRLSSPSGAIMAYSASYGLVLLVLLPLVWWRIRMLPSLPG